MVLEDKLARLATTSSIVFSALLLVVAAFLWFDREDGAASGPKRIGTFDRAALERAIAPDGPTVDVLEPLAGSWSAVAEEADVDGIVEAPLWLGAGVERVDVTPLLLEHLLRDDGRR